LALVAVYLAVFRDYVPHLAPGEVATIAVLAANRPQARSIFRYISGILKAVPLFARMVVDENTEAITLANRVVIEIGTASFRTTRGYSFAAVLCDEIAFWRPTRLVCFRHCPPAVRRSETAKGLEPPKYKPRPPRSRIADPFEPYLKERLAAYRAALEEWTRARSARLGGDAEQSRQCAQGARGARERDGAYGASGGGGRGLSRGAGGKDARARSARLGALPAWTGECAGHTGKAPEECRAHGRSAYVHARCCRSV
jgi:hypothetical protein